MSASIDGNFAFHPSDVPDVGTLEISMDAKLLINDGQHRKAAILEALSEDDTLSDETISIATVYKGNIIKNLIMDCQSYTKYRPNETTGGIFVSWRRKEELPTGA